MRFGERLRALRRARGLSLRELGQRLGVSYAYIIKVENGKLAFSDSPSAGLIRKLPAQLDDTQLDRVLAFLQRR